jgi:hypothetical protein
MAVIGIVMMSLMALALLGAVVAWVRARAFARRDGRRAAGSDEAPKQ